MWTLLKKLLKRLSVGVAVIVILLAIGVGAFRLLITQLPSYQGEIQAWARDALGVTVNFSSLDARWGLLGPELTFHDASVSRTGEDATPLVSAREVRLGLSALAMITERQLEVSRLTLEGTELKFERSSDGSLRLQGSPSGGDSDAGSALALEDLPQVVIIVSDSNIIYEDRVRERSWDFDDVRVELTREADRALLEVRASAPAALASRIEVSAETSLVEGEGQPDRNWRVFAEIRDLDLAVLSTLTPEPAALPGQGEGDVSVWLDLTGNRVNQGTVQLAFDDLRLQDVPSSDNPIYDRARLTAEWTRVQDGWELALSNLDLSRGGRTWPGSASLDLRILQGAEGLAELEVRSGFLRLEDLWPLVLAFPQSQLTELWREFAPRGDLEGVDFSIVRGFGEWEYSAAAKFTEIGLSPRGEWPGVTALSGELRADSRSGRVALATRDAVMDWPALLREPVAVDELSGILVWRQGRDGLRFVSDNLVFRNRDASTRSSLEFTYPMDGSAPSLELESDIFGFDIVAAKRYLPASKMPESVVAYLDAAILGGRVPRAHAVFFGPLDAFPFDDGEGQFEAQVEIENGSMAFVAGWPHAEELTGTIDFLNSGWIARGHGRVLGNESDNVRVAMADMRNGVLTAEADTIGPLEDVLGFLKGAPLMARHLGPDLARLEAGAGRGHVTFDLSLPLLDRLAYRLDGALEVMGGEISVAGFEPSARDIQGVLRLEGGFVSGEGIEATLMDGPVMVAVRQPEEPGYLATIAFDGEVDVEVVHETFGLPLQGYVAGQTRWQGALLLPQNTYTQARREPLRVSVGSNLSGVALRLPQPLSKAPDDPTNFQLDLVFSELDRLDVTGHVGAARRFALSFRNREGELSFRRGSIRFGGAYPLLPPRDGLNLSGSLGQVNLEEWWDLFEAEGADSSRVQLLLGADLEIADLTAFGQRLGHTVLSVRQQATQWHLEIDSEPVAGEIDVPLDLRSRPQMVAEMERLNISTSEGATATPQDPHGLPGLLIQAEQFAVGPRRFGSLSADIQSDPLGLRMVSFATESDSFATEGSGGWFDGNQDSTTRLAITLRSNDVATTLEQLGLDPIAEGESADVALSVYWPGAPSADWTQAISGDVTLRLERGSVLNLEPGAGRMMGLMSINALPRRLALDFRDVFNKGLVFDEVNGDFLVVNGNAYTDNLHLTGPVADIGVVGRTGLRDQDYQQQAVVTAEPGKILPTMGFLAGPQVGAALFLFTQIFKEPLRGIGRASYCVTGSWYEPAVDRLTPAELAEDKLCADLPPGSDLAQQ